MFYERLNISEKDIVNNSLFNEISLKRLYCSICLYLAENPMYCNLCLKVYCRKCQEIKGYNKKTCPNKCTKENVNDITEFYYQCYSNLIIKCPKCLNKFHYPKLTTHVCQFTNKLKESEIYTSKKSDKINDSQKNNSMKGEKVKCNFCSKEVLFDDIEFHLKLECILSRAIVKCEHCSSVFKEDEIKQHYNICEIRINNSCPECSWYNDDKVLLQKHIVLCKKGLQNKNYLHNGIMKNSKFTIKDNNLKINNDLNLGLNSNNYVFIKEDFKNELELNLINLSQMLISYHKSLEPNFCRKCGIIMKNKEMVNCELCNKIYCCNCCNVCIKCNKIADSICLKPCIVCKQILCKECEKNSNYICLCEEEIICNKCNHDIFNYRILHVCKFLQIIESLNYVLKCPKNDNECEIYIKTFKENSLTIYFLDDNLIQVYKSHINLTSDEIIRIVFKDMQISIISKNSENERRHNISILFIILNFDNMFSLEKSIHIIKNMVFSNHSKNKNTSFYPIEQIKFINIKK